MFPFMWRYDLNESLLSIHFFSSGALATTLRVPMLPTALDCPWLFFFGRDAREVTSQIRYGNGENIGYIH